MSISALAGLLRKGYNASAMRALVVDDDKDLSTLIAERLRHENFAVDAVHSGDSGAYAARTHDYDVVLLDNRLPDKPGVQVCREVRLAGKTMPIIVLSAIRTAKDKVDLLDAGADDYLAKPFSFEELLARIRALLRRPQPLLDELLEIDRLSLDTRTQRVAYEGVEVHLTRKEYMLLQYLMRNQGSVISRGMLMEHVWDMEADPFSNTIEAHVLSLRKKIGRDGPHLIRTIFGRGYKIAPISS